MTLCKKALASFETSFFTCCSFDTWGHLQSLADQRGFCGLLKKAFSKAAGMRGRRGVLVLYVEGFERLRTKLGAFFSSRVVVHFDLEA